MSSGPEYFFTKASLPLPKPSNPQWYGQLLWGATVRTPRIHHGTGLREGKANFHNASATAVRDQESDKQLRGGKLRGDCFHDRALSVKMTHSLRFN
jgi:hypothetical protein